MIKYIKEPRGALVGLYSKIARLCRLPPPRWFRPIVPDIDGTLVQGLCGVEDAAAGRGSYQVKGLCLGLKQFFALLVKRLHHTTRSYKDFFAQVASPRLVPIKCLNSNNNNNAFYLYSTSHYKISKCYG